MTYLVHAKQLRKHFPVGRGFFAPSKRTVKAVDGVTMGIRKEEIFGLAGESGSGKTTIGRLLLRLVEADEGEVWFNGVNILTLDSRGLRKLRPRMTMVFQNPFASLNPRKTVGQIIGQPITIANASNKEVKTRVHELLTEVGLLPSEEFYSRYPHELSGGQRQRVVIARSLSTDPEFIVADEPVASLDIAVRGEILNLMKRLQSERGISILLITHDLAVLRSMANKIGILYLGTLVESGDVNEIFSSPRHPYTQALLHATPVSNPVEARKRKKVILKGEIPSPIDIPPGCRFHTRCPYVQDKCRGEVPLLETDTGNRFFACHYPLGSGEVRRVG